MLSRDLIRFGIIQLMNIGAVNVIKCTAVNQYGVDLLVQSKNTFLVLKSFLHCEESQFVNERKRHKLNMINC